MKKCAALALCLAICLSMAGCTNDTSGIGSTSSITKNQDGDDTSRAVSYTHLGDGKDQHGGALEGALGPLGLPRPQVEVGQKPVEQKKEGAPQHKAAQGGDPAGLPLLLGHLDGGEDVYKRQSSGGPTPGRGSRRS